MLKQNYSLYIISHIFQNCNNKLSDFEKVRQRAAKPPEQSVEKTLNRLNSQGDALYRRASPSLNQSCGLVQIHPRAELLKAAPAGAKGDFAPAGATKGLLALWKPRQRGAALDPPLFGRLRRPLTPNRAFSTS